jgi:hypothetical protein
MECNDKTEFFKSFTLLETGICIFPVVKTTQSKTESAKSREPIPLTIFYANHTESQVIRVDMMYLYITKSFD